MEKLAVGIIGLGRIGKIHARNVLRHMPQVTIKAAVDSKLDEDWLKQYPIEHVSHDPDAIFSDDSIAAVLICTPADTHVDLIMKAASAGKHIFCEKPIALQPELIRQAMHHCAAAKIKLQVGFNRRFDPDFSAVKKQIDDNQLGELNVIRITSRDPEPPPFEYTKQCGGLFLDMTIHDFDMARFLANSEVDEVFAMGDALINPELKAIGDIDTAITTLRFKNGVYAIIDNSRQAVYGYDQRIEVFGRKGCIQVDNCKQNHTLLSTAQAVTMAKPLYFLERYSQSFILELQAFFDSILHEKEVPVTAYDGLMPVLIGLAAMQSLNEKKTIRVASE